MRNAVPTGTLGGGSAAWTAVKGCCNTMPRPRPPITWYMIQVTLLEVGVRVVKRAQERVIAIMPRVAKGV
jgi:hypothetical protein